MYMYMYMYMYICVYMCICVMGEVCIRFHPHSPRLGLPLLPGRGGVCQDPHLRHRRHPATGQPPPGTWHLAPGTWHQAPGTRHQTPGTRHKAQGTRHQAPGTWHLAPSGRHLAPGTRHQALLRGCQTPLQTAHPWQTAVHCAVHNWWIKIAAI